MESAIVGRKNEIKQLDRIVASPRAELVAVYGRRRVGKTFLVKEYFHNDFDFYVTGVYNGSRRVQLQTFARMLSEKTGTKVGKLSSWIDAFSALKQYLESLSNQRIIVFFDELPWFDTHAGKFLQAFEWFWNTYGSTKSNLKMIVCGSATTWMTDKFISGKGGLYNRTTERIYLRPFTLAEAESLLLANDIMWDRSLVLQAYMAVGGVPFYLMMLQDDLSVDANIDRLYFAEGAPLRQEFNFLFQSLFSDSELYGAIVNAIASKNIGITRADIVKLCGISDNGALTRALNNLISCDFIRKYSAFGKKKKESMYQLTDLAILFHKRFVENYDGKDSMHWTNMIDNPARRAWTGIAFEQVCLLHIPQIKRSLSIAGVQADVSAWRFVGDEYYSGFQIDMIIERRDRVINLCEMKYSDAPFEITPSYATQLRERRATFKAVTGTRSALHLTMISPYGLRRNASAGIANQIITLDDLFS